jgi:hypothetical protein
MAGAVSDHRADGEPAKCPESLRPMPGVPPWGRRSFHLLREHYFSFFAPTDSFASRSGLSSTSVFPRWRSLRRLSPAPAARRTFPTLSPRIFPWMLDPIPRRSHSVLLPVASAVSSAFPTRSWVGFPRIVRLKRLRAGRRFRGGRYFFMFRPPILCCPPGRPYRCAYYRRAAGAFTSGQNVLRYLRTHRIC